MQGQLGLRIKIWDHSQTRFDTTNLMAFCAMNLLAISELINKILLKIVFLKVSTIVLIYVKFSETEHTSRLMLTSKV